MSQQKTSGMFGDALKSLFKSVFKILAILCAWIMKAGGIILSKTAEAIEKIIIKKSG